MTTVSACKRKKSLADTFTSGPSPCVRMSSPADFGSSPDSISNMLLNHLDRPVVFSKAAIQEWPENFRRLDLFGETIGLDRMLEFRIGYRHQDHVIQWEQNCDVVIATFEQFMNFCFHPPGSVSQSIKTDKGGLSNYSPNEHWSYASYLHIGQHFAENKMFIDGIKWDVFGFPGRNGRQSTMWIGTTDSYTPCHYDTYGINLVAQILGRKTWLLFPPSSEGMYPTRIPYEESSVYSSVNIMSPDYTLHPKYKKATPYTVTLEPGETLFVPRHWWHFVIADEASVSVNTWIDTSLDHRERVKESIVRMVTYSVKKHELDLDKDNKEHDYSKGDNLPTTQVAIGKTADGEDCVFIISQDDDDARDKPSWMAPSEEISDFVTNLSYINNALKRFALHPSRHQEEQGPAEREAVGGFGHHVVRKRPRPRIMVTPSSGQVESSGLELGHSGKRSLAHLYDNESISMVDLCSDDIINVLASNKVVDLVTQLLCDKLGIDDK